MKCWNYTNCPLILQRRYGTVARRHGRENSGASITTVRQIERRAGRGDHRVAVPRQASDRCRRHQSDGRTQCSRGPRTKWHRGKSGESSPPATTVQPTDRRTGDRAGPTDRARTRRERDRGRGERNGSRRWKAERYDNPINPYKCLELKSAI